MGADESVIMPRIMVGRNKMVWVLKSSMNGMLTACLVVDSNTDDFE